MTTSGERSAIAPNTGTWAKNISCRNTVSTSARITRRSGELGVDGRVHDGPVERVLGWVRTWTMSRSCRSA